MIQRFGIWPALPGLLALGLSGCSIDPSYFAPTAAQVVLLDVPMGILGPLEDEIPDAGTSISVTLVRVGQSGTSFSEDDLLVGADVTLHFVTNPESTSLGMGGEAPRVQAGEVQLTIPESPDYPGVYFLNSNMDERLVYNPGVNYMVKVAHGGENYEICMVSAPRTTLESPLWAEYVEVGSDVPVSYAPEAAVPFLGVFDSTGSVAFTNFPTDPTGLYQWLTSGSGATTRIPGASLLKEDLFGVAVAGMRIADWSSTGESKEGSPEYLSSNLNPIGSIFMSGSAAVTSITTLPLDFVNGRMIGGLVEGDPAGVEVESWTIDPLELVTGGSIDVSPKLGEEVWIETPDGLLVEMRPVSGSAGLYRAEPDSRLSYEPMSLYTLHLTDRYENERRFSFMPEPSVELDIPGDDGRYWVESGDGLELRWAPVTDGADIRVYNQDGAIVYSTSVGGGGAFDSKEKDGTGSLVLPPDAFPEGPGLYQVGVMGLTRSMAGKDGKSYGLNLEYSGVLTGEPTFAVVNVGESTADASAD